MQKMQNSTTQQTASISPTPPHGGSPVANFLVLLLVNAMWAFQFSGAKIVTERLGPISTALIPLALSTILFAPFLVFRRKAETGRKLNGKILIQLLTIGTLGVMPAQLGLTWGVQYSLASNAAVITLTIPVVTVLMASILLHEKMTVLRWISFALAIVGVAIVSKVDLHSSDLFRGGYLIGNLLIVASCVGSAFNNTYSKKLLENLSELELMVYSFLVADLELLLLMLIFERSAFGKLSTLDASTWWSLGLIAIFSLSLSMMLYFWVIQRIDVMQASLSVYLLPIFGVLFSWALLHEGLTMELIAGGVLVFVATFLITVQEERQKRRAAALVPDQYSSAMAER